MILLSYLTTLPEYFGWPASAPFLNMDIVFSMLRISPDRRKNRIWQRDYFSRNGVSNLDFLEKGDRRNSLDYDVMKNAINNKAFKLLDNKVFEDFISHRYIDSVNKSISTFPTKPRESFYQLTFKWRYLRGFLRFLSLPYNVHLRHLYSFLIIKAIEKTLKGEF